MRIVVGAIALALLASLALNAWLGGRVVEQYLVAQEVRLDPVGLARYPLGPQATKRDRSAPRVVFFGDSRALAWTDAARLPGFEAVNRGIGRETSAQALERFERHVAPLRPDIVVVQVGVNDLKVVALRPERQGEIVDACVANIEAIVARAEALGAGVVLSTVFPVGKPPLFVRPFAPEATRDAVAAVNERLRGLAGPKRVVLDAASLLGDRQGGVADAFAHDWLHIGPAGYAALNADLLRAVERVSGSAASVEKLP